VSSVISDRVDVDRALRDVSNSESTNPFSYGGKLAPFFFELRQKSKELGLDDLSLVPVGEARTFPIFLERVRRGCCDGLPYLVSNLEARRSPLSVLPDAQTLIVVALSEKRVYEESKETTDSIYNDSALDVSFPSPSGKIVGYATNLDYHDVLKRRLKQLGAFLRERWQNASIRAVVDTAPLLEKDWATSSGLGFCGLHSLVIHRNLGTRFFLGELLVSIPFFELSGVETSEEFLAELQPLRRREEPRQVDVKSASDACLACRSCVDACPTRALSGDRTLDARRCINFWTIENRETIPSEIATKLDGKLFGCDLCQQVCPWNNGVFHSPQQEVALEAIENLDEATFRRLFKKTPLFRATLAGLRQTAKILKKTPIIQNSLRRPSSNDANVKK